MVAIVAFFCMDGEHTFDSWALCQASVVGPFAIVLSSVWLELWLGWHSLVGFLSYLGGLIPRDVDMHEEVWGDANGHAACHWALAADRFAP